MRVGILVVIACCAAVMAVAQTQRASSPAAPRPLSLEQCVQLALVHNLDVQIAQASTELARFNLNSAYGAYDPVLSFGATHSYVDQPGDFDPQKFNQDYPYQLTTGRLTPALEGLLPIGMNYSLGATVGHKSALTDFRSNTNDARYFSSGIRDTNNYFAEAGVSARQHLLKDFWVDQPRAVLRVRRKEVKMTEQSLRFRVSQILLAVELGYYDLIAAREQVQVEEKALELRQQLVVETRRRVEVGDLPALDAEQAETQLENTLTALTASREAYVARQNALKILLTDDFREWVDVDLMPTDALLALAPEVHRAESFQTALKTRPDLEEARLAVEKSDVLVEFRRNQLFPSLDLIGHYGGQGVAGSSSSAVSDTFHFQNPDYFYGVVVSLPLTRTAERNNYRASQATMQLAKLQLKKAEQGVFLEIADWVNRVQSRFAQVGSTHRARKYAEAALAAEQKKLQNGLSTSFFVLQLQETLTAARTAEELALADYNKALARLAFAEGSMLNRHHFTVEVK